MGSKIKLTYLKQREPKIIIPWEVKADIDNIVSQKDGEIGWIGEAEKIDNDLYLIKKVTVPKQKAHSTTTEIYDDGILDLINEEPDFDFDKFRYWGHSHGKMLSVYPSVQDDDMMKEFSESCEWFIGTIHNHKGDIYGYMVDMVSGIYFSDIEVIIESHEKLIPLNDKIDKLLLEITKLEYESEELLKTLKLERDSTINWKDIVDKRVKVFNEKNQNTHLNTAYKRNNNKFFDNKVNVKGNQRNNRSKRKKNNEQRSLINSIEEVEAYTKGELDFVKPVHISGEIIDDHGWSYMDDYFGHQIRELTVSNLLEEGSNELPFNTDEHDPDYNPYDYMVNLDGMDEYPLVHGGITRMTEEEYEDWLTQRDF